jgi:hypothetical protein
VSDARVGAGVAKGEATVPDVETDVHVRGRGHLTAANRPRSPLGRPRGSTTIQSDAQLRELVQAMRRDHVRITRKVLAARSGFTEADLRGYLKATNRTFREFLATF